MNATRQFPLAYLFAWLVAAMALADVLCRFIPLETVAFRAQEPASRYAYGFGPFQPNKHYVIERSYGDLVNIGNLPARYRRYRRETFSTDELGFRNPYPVARPIDLLLLGSSFVTGHGLSDDEILSVRVHERTGKSVFNGGFMRLDLTRTMRLLDELQMRQGTVVADLFERGGWPQKADMQRYDSGRKSAFALRWHALTKIWEGFWRIAVPNVLVDHLFDFMARRGWISFPHALQSTPLTLTNGDEMVFYNKDIEIARQGREVDLDGMRMLKDAVERRGLQFYVLLIPTKYSVYAPFVSGSPGNINFLAPLNEIENKLNALGVHTLNVAPCLEQKARRLFPSHAYDYWLDDTHWNATGSECADRLLASLYAKRSATACP